MAPGSGPRGLAFHPTKRVAYVNGELDGTVAACAIGADGALTRLAAVRVYPADFAGRDHPENLGKADFWLSEVAVSACGAFLFAVCRVDQSIAVVHLADDGDVARVASRARLLPRSNARNLARHGDLLLVASQDADAVEVFRIAAADGALTRVDTHEVKCAADVAVVPRRRPG